MRAIVGKIEYKEHHLPTAEVWVTFEVGELERLEKEAKYIDKIKKKAIETIVRYFIK